MSSLAATQADGYYIPRSYHDSGSYKRQSVSQHAGSAGHNQYLLRGVVRFELPLPAVCTTCGTAIGKGTRFNARKTRVDNYHSSIIYEFRFKCGKCEHECVVRNDPKTRDYLYVSGIRKKVVEFDALEAGARGTVECGPDVGGKPDVLGLDDPIARLER